MHSVGHIEIPTTNLKRAKKFFGTIFGWEFKDYPEVKYVTFKTGVEPGGGFMLVKKMPKKGQVNVYINVEDIDAKLKEIKKARGKVLTKKTPVSDMGFFAQFQTPDGCALCLWENLPKAQAVAPAAAEPAPVV
ncbi:MAG TPA: VOC family protein [Bacteroidota bacterium]|nr:VOC family protein [Bacteroidota bacterium]